MGKTNNAIAYTRFSSDLQREESIEAQIRAIKKYCDDQGFVLLTTFADRGVSAKSDDRPEFQRMISRACEGDVNAVIVHKLDRFARNRYDSAHYRSILKKHNVKLLSVLENLQDTPESVIMESLIEGMNEYYSLNLSREVRKGLAENAYSARTTGGPPPLGYSVDPETKKFIINDFEAEAVRLIFDMYLHEHSYTEIITALNSKGYKTRRGVPFAKNSLYEILKNERYTGVYIYVKDTTKNAKGKYTRHGATYDPNVVIRIPGGMPAIISEEVFNQVREKMMHRQHTSAKFSAKQEYLLSGKVFCGECGSPYAGNSRRASATPPLYVSYKCTRRNQRNDKCKNPEINREKIEQAVLQKLSRMIFNPDVLPALVQRYNEYMAEKSGNAKNMVESLKKELASVETKIDKTVDLLIETGSAAIKLKLAELEERKITLSAEVSRLESEISANLYSLEKVRSLFQQAEQQLRNGTLANRRAVIDQYVDKVLVYPEKIEVYLKILGGFETKEVINIK